jgi:DNA-binding LacI/PurR family transcriptional regulator
LTALLRRYVLIVDFIVPSFRPQNRHDQRKVAALCANDCRKRAGMINTVDCDRRLAAVPGNLVVIMQHMSRVKRGGRSAKKPGPRGPAPTDRKLQMDDIARLAGVSVSTVSRALNQSPLVNDETRNRILELARSLNYSINFGASNLRMQRNRTVAVVVPYDAKTRQHISDPFFVSILGSLADALTDRGYDMLLSRVDAERLDLAAQIEASGRAGGIILIGQWHHHDQLNELAARRVPIVVWGARLTQQIYCTVGGDNIAGGVLATEHLIGTGRRHIAFFGDPELPEVGHRYEGYLRALKQHAISFDSRLVRPAAFAEGSARRAVEELIAQKVHFDAIFASSDLLAMRAVRTLREHGFLVPRDVGVVGYDDVELAQYFHPSLTTIRQPIIKAGEALVDALLAVMAGEHPTPPILPTELIVRESSAPRPADV